MQHPTARSLAAANDQLPDGVLIAPLTLYDDERGAFAELYREAWELGPRPLQWNYSHSVANVLRGVHTHEVQYDYLVVVAGTMILALRDSRASSSTFGRASMMTLEWSDPHMVVIPPGVSHGFYCPEPSAYVLGVSAYFTQPENLDCRWDDPEMGFAWPCDAPLLSNRDAKAGTYSEMLARFAAKPAAS